MALVLLGLVGMIVVLLLLLTRGGGAPPPPVATPTSTPDPLDVGALFLEISSPPEAETVVLAPELTVAGRTRSDAAITINDLVVSPDLNGRFSADLTLEPGTNIIEVVVSVASGEQLDEVLAVIYTPE